MQSIQTGLSLAIDGAPGAAVAAGRIVIASGTNTGNGAVSTAKAIGFLGVTAEATDSKGYANVANAGVVDVIAGGSVSFGASIASDANGAGVSVTPANTGALTQVVGTALSAAATGNTFRMLIMPSLGLS